MDRNKLEARLQVIAEEAAELLEEQKSIIDRPDEQRTEDHDAAYETNEERLDELTKERTKITGQLERLTRIEKLAKDEKTLVEGVPSFNANTKKDPFDLNDLRGNVSRSELRGRARTAVEEVEGYMSDDAREAVTKKLEQTDDPRSVIPNLILRTGSPAYRSAFGKMATNRREQLDHDEREAVNAVQEWRLMSLGATDGGEAVPFTLDPTLISTNAGSINPIRQIARNVSIVTDAWNGLTSAGVTARWGAENTAATDDSPTDFANPNIPVYKAEAFIKGSIEIFQDYQAIEADLGMMIAEGKDNLEATAHISGAGTTEPLGIVTELAGGGSIVTPATAEAFAVGDVYNLLAVLPPARRPNASWVAELSTLNAMRAFGATYGSSFLSELSADSPARVLGRPVYEASAMDPFSGVDASETDTTNHILLVGDFSRYVVVDRVGLTVEFIPHLFNGATPSMPTGTRGLFAYWRTGAGSVDDNAFRLLNIATAS
jgi:HK97 family phage major capsid protein